MRLYTQAPGRIHDTRISHTVLTLCQIYLVGYRTNHTKRTLLVVGLKSHIMPIGGNDPCHTSGESSTDHLQIIPSSRPTYFRADS